MISVFELIVHVCNMELATGVSRLISLGWITRHPETRKLMVTEKGKDYFFHTSEAGFLQVEQKQIPTIRIILTTME